MAELVNLRIARKRRAREDAVRTADKSRIAHGTSRVEKRRAAADQAKSNRKLDQHRVEPGVRQ